MTPAAILFRRTGTIGLMTAATLLVDSIYEFGDVFIAFIRRMTLAAGLGLIEFVISERVMTVIACQSVAGI